MRHTSSFHSLRLSKLRPLLASECDLTDRWLSGLSISGSGESEWTAEGLEFGPSTDSDGSQRRAGVDVDRLSRNSVISGVLACAERERVEAESSRSCDS